MTARQAVIALAFALILMGLGGISLEFIMPIMLLVIDRKFAANFGVNSISGLVDDPECPNLFNRYQHGHIEKSQLPEQCKQIMHITDGIMDTYVNNAKSALGFTAACYWLFFGLVGAYLTHQVTRCIERTQDERTRLVPRRGYSTQNTI